MFGNTIFGNFTGSSTSSASTPSTSWHPIQTTSSYDLWEIPQSSTRAFDEEEEEDHREEKRARTMFDFDLQLTSSLSSWSFSHSSSQDHSTPPASTGNRERLGSHSSTSRRLASSNDHKKQALGDATNTAPVLRVSSTTSNPTPFL